MGENFKDLKLSIYEAYFLDKFFTSNGETKNPFKLNEKL